MARFAGLSLFLVFACCSIAILLPSSIVRSLAARPGMHLHHSRTAAAFEKVISAVFAGDAAETASKDAAPAASNRVALGLISLFAFSSIWTLAAWKEELEPSRQTVAHMAYDEVQVLTLNQAA
jgi:hypothetical protein